MSKLLCLAGLFFSICFSILKAQESPQAKPLPSTAEKYLLRYHFDKGHTVGDTIRWNVRHTLHNTISVSGKSEVIETSSLSTKSWTVLNIDEDGTTTFEYQVDDVNMKSLKTDYLQERTVEQYNSRTDELVPAGFLPLEGTIGVPLAHLTISVRGELLKKKALRFYSDANHENRIAIPLPEKPVAVGESWTIPLPLEIKKSNDLIEKKISAQQQFTLESVKTGVARIRFVTQVLSILTPREESQIISKYARGYLDLDIDAGHIIRQETTVDHAVVGFQGPTDSVDYKSRQTECCCGLRSCELCSAAGEKE